MKYYLLLLVLCCSAFPLIAQQSVHPSRKLTPLHAAAVPASTVSIPADTLQGETVAHLNAYIQAIDTKVEYVSNDQSLREKAMVSGWFDQMKVARARAVAKRDALIATGGG